MALLEYVMQKLDWRKKVFVTGALCLLCFLSYLFFRVRMASGLPVVHTLWSFELASLLRTTAKSVQLLGLLACVTTSCAAIKKCKKKEPYIYVQVLQASVLGALSFLAPDLATSAIPILFGLDF